MFLHFFSWMWQNQHGDYSAVKIEMLMEKINLWYY